jgi:hypothetical protein
MSGKGGNIGLGMSNRGINDNCNYQQRLYESVSPLSYDLALYAQENANRCRYDKFWTRQMLTEIESDLLGYTRPLSQCNQFKYSPNCTKSNMCISTYDKSVPVVYPPELCGIVYNNIPKNISNGLYTNRKRNSGMDSLL